ncbi:unnamed protein product, partial [Polarella glacialis]
ANCGWQAGVGSFVLHPYDNSSHVLGEVSVNDVIFVSSRAFFNPSLAIGASILEDGDFSFYVTASSGAVRSSAGVPMAERLDSLAQADAYFKYKPIVRMRLVSTSLEYDVCLSTLLPDVELYFSEHIKAVNISAGKRVSLTAAGCKSSACEDDEVLWRLLASNFTDAGHLQVTLDPKIPFKATLHASKLPPRLSGTRARPMRTGARLQVLVDEGLFEDRGVWIQENITIELPPLPPPPPPANCSDYSSCPEYYVVRDNASEIRCALRDECTIADNMTCCEIVITTTTTTVTFTTVTSTRTFTDFPYWMLVGNDTNNSVARDFAVEDRRMYEEEVYVPVPRFETRILSIYQVFGNEELPVPIDVCETRYEDPSNLSVRIYAPFKVKSEVGGQLRPVRFEILVPTTSVQDPLYNMPGAVGRIYFTHDTKVPQLYVPECYPPDFFDATTPEESIVLRFDEAVQAGEGFFELWDEADASGPKIRVDVAQLAKTYLGFPGRKLISGRSVSIVPTLLCEGKAPCPQFEYGSTYFLATSKQGVLRDALDNPLPQFSTNGTWRFAPIVNITAAPEVIQEDAVSVALEEVEIVGDKSSTFVLGPLVAVGYLHFTQRVRANPNFAWTPLMIEFCGQDFDCSNEELISLDDNETWTTSSALVTFGEGFNRSTGLEYGILQFKYHLDFSTVPAGRYRATLLAGSVLGASPGPLSHYIFYFDTGPLPAVRLPRPLLLDGGYFPVADAVDVPASTRIVMYFDEEVIAGSGYIRLCADAETQEENMTGCGLGKFADASPAVASIKDTVVERRKVTIKLAKDLAFGQTLFVQIDAGLVRSARTNAPSEFIGGANWSFKVAEGDTEPPRADFILGAAFRHSEVKISFSEAIQFTFAAGNQGPVPMVEAESGLRVMAHGVISGNVLTIQSSWEGGMTYSAHEATSVIADFAGNMALPLERTLKAPEEYVNFTISSDAESPVATMMPSGGEVDLHEVFWVELDEATTALPGGRVTLSSRPQSCGVTCGERKVVLNRTVTSLRSATLEVDGRLQTRYQIQPDEPLLPGINYTLLFTSGSFADLAENVLLENLMVEVTSFLRKDIKAPRLVAASIGGGGSPGNNFDQNSELPASARGLELFFSESVQMAHPPEQSSMRLEPSSGESRCSSQGACSAGANCRSPCGYTPASTVLPIPNSVIQVSGARAFVPAADLPQLESGRGYQLRWLSGLFTDLAGNSLMNSTRAFETIEGGLDDSDRQNFSYPVRDSEIVLISVRPGSGDRMVSQSASLKLEFAEDVKAGPGSFKLVPTVSQVSGITPSEVSMLAKSCHFEGSTVTCIPPVLLQLGASYSVVYTTAAMLDAQDEAIGMGPNGRSPSFTVIDVDIDPPLLLSVGPSGQMPPRTLSRRLSAEGGLWKLPKPKMFAARGALLTLNFTEEVQAGVGDLIILDCSPGDTALCFDGTSEHYEDLEVMRINVSGADGQSKLLFQGLSVLVVTENLKPGSLHAIRTDSRGTFRDKVGNSLLSVSSGFEFWVQPDDARPLASFLQVPSNNSIAPPNTNITIYFSELVQ